LLGAVDVAAQQRHRQVSIARQRGVEQLLVFIMLSTRHVLIASDPTAIALCVVEQDIGQVEQQSLCKAREPRDQPGLFRANGRYDLCDLADACHWREKRAIAGARFRRMRESKWSNITASAEESQVKDPSRSGSRHPDAVMIKVTNLAGWPA
jgi:hypothetical protein